MRQMKDSGIEWIGAIPAEWETKKCKYFASLYTGNSIKDEEKHNYEDNEDAHPYISSKDIDGDSFIVNYENGMYVKNYDGSFVCANKDDTLLCVEGGSAGRKIAYLDRKVSFVNKLCCCHPHDIVPRFLYYSILSPNYKTEFDLNLTGLIGGVSVNKLINFRVPLPPLPEQQRIAAYLDAKCSEIDRAMSRTRESIAEYKKLKQSIITEAVTGKITNLLASPERGRGPRSGEGVKPSGIEWIGDIPAEWEVVNPKALFQQRKQKALIDDVQLTASQQYGVIYQHEYIFKTGTKVMQVEKDFEILKHVENGDFVISMRSFQGGLEYSTVSGSISSAYVMLIPNLCLVYPPFYRWLFKSQIYIDALQSTSNLVRDGQAMRYSNFSQVRLFMLPMDEQKNIANYLDQKCSEIDGLIARKERLIEELEKYKKSLIYECVTGKRKVR